MNQKKPKRIELLKCPFCGGSASIAVYAENHYTVECDNVCIANCAVYDSREDAVMAWNKRFEG